MGVRRRNPRQHVVDRHRGRPHRAEDQRHLYRVRSVPGFDIDPARAATPTINRGRARVPYVRHNFFAEESFTDLADARVRAETWCSATAGMRIHGTTQCRPIEAFRSVEAPLLLPGPGPALRHAELVRAQGPPRLRLRSRPGHLLGAVPPGRPDAALPARLDALKLYLTGELVKVHPREPPGQPAHRSGRLPHGHGDLRHPGHRTKWCPWRPCWSFHRPLRRRHLRHPAAMDQDAASLSPFRPSQEVGPRTRRTGLLLGPSRPKPSTRGSSLG